ncbi:MAG TPA: sugar phosphate nucleotidyltransferase, partial [Burkholderiaceae bacterium]|nr:sugar phosphate nucleotidyltransferase [Burkholderiaceae bacterium]
RQYLGNDPFCLTYGDGVCDLDVGKLIEFHKSHRLHATLTAVQPEGRFGAFQLKEGDPRIDSFREKPKGDGAWINGGFFVCEPAVFDYIDGDATVWEQEPLRALATQGQLGAYRHEGFWQPMDTLRDKNVLEALWASGKAPWKRW